MLKLVAVLALVAAVAVSSANATGGHPPKPKHHTLVKVCWNGKTHLVSPYSVAWYVKYGAKLGACPKPPPVVPPTIPPTTTPPATSPPAQVNRILACATKPVFRSADGSLGLSGDVTAAELASGMFQGAAIVIARYYAGVGATCDNLGGSPNGKTQDGYPVWVR